MVMLSRSKKRRDFYLLAKFQYTRFYTIDDDLKIARNYI